MLKMFLMYKYYDQACQGDQEKDSKKGGDEIWDKILLRNPPD